MKGWIVLCVVVFAACSEQKIPDQYMNQEEMAMILYDIYLAEGKLSSDITKASSVKLYPVYKDFILEKHGISDSVYNANMSFYLTNPIYLDKVYEIVLDSMQVRRQTIQ